MTNLTPYTGCPCRACIDAYDKANPPASPLHAVGFSRFIVCPTCGNKRCPHATNHTHACTGSNEPGQAGSVYE